MRRVGQACVTLTAPANVGASVTLAGIAGEAVPTVPLKALPQGEGGAGLFSAYAAPSSTDRLRGKLQELSPAVLIFRDQA